LPSALTTIVEAELERRGYVTLTIEGRPRYLLLVKDGSATLALVKEGAARRIPEDLKTLADNTGLNVVAISRLNGSIHILQLTLYNPKIGCVKHSTTTVSVKGG